MSTCGVHVNLDQVRDTIQDLLKLRHVPIKDLERKFPPIRRKFNDFLHLVGNVKNSDAYDEIFKIVEKETRSINSIEPGTIGAYFKGCLLPVSFPDNPSCSEICASSFQPPHTMDGWFSCGKIVIRVKWNPKFSTDLISKGDNPGYLLIDHTTLSEFPGFSNQEKIELKRLGLTSCKLLSVSVTGKEYRELIGGFHSVDTLPSRVTRNENTDREFNEVESKENRSPWIAMFFFLIVLIAIGIFSLLQLSNQQDRRYI